MIAVMGGGNMGNSPVVHEIIKNSPRAGISQIIGSYKAVEGFGMTSKPNMPSVSLADINRNSASYRFGVSRVPLCFSNAEHYALNKHGFNLSTDTTERERQLTELQTELPEANQRRVNDIAKVIMDDKRCSDLIVLGGDGTMRCLRDFNSILKNLPEPYRNLRVIGVPTGMDNNFYTNTTHGTIDTAVLPGHASAIAVTQFLTSQLTPTCSDNARLQLIEHMGGLYTGWDAASTTLGPEGAHILICREMIHSRDPEPEGKFRVDAGEFKDHLVRTIMSYATDGFVKVGIFEATPHPTVVPEEGTYVWEENQGYYSSRSRKTGAANLYQDLLMSEREVLEVFTPSPQPVGYFAKSWNTIAAYDYALAEAIGEKMGELLREQASGVYVSLSELVTAEHLNADHINNHPLSKVPDFDKPLPDEYLDFENLTSTEAYIEFASTLHPHFDSSL